MAQVELIRIGNSRGVRIPKSIIEQCGFGDRINLRVEDGRVILARDGKPREGWSEAVRTHPATDELLLDEITETDFDRDEWTW
jgi:antitoxin MazE